MDIPHYSLCKRKLLYSVHFGKSESIECCLLIFRATNAAANLLYFNSFHLYLNEYGINVYRSKKDTPGD